MSRFRRRLPVLTPSVPDKCAPPRNPSLSRTPKQGARTLAAGSSAAIRALRQPFSARGGDFRTPICARAPPRTPCPAQHAHLAVLSIVRPPGGNDNANQDARSDSTARQAPLSPFGSRFATSSPRSLDAPGRVCSCGSPDPRRASCRRPAVRASRSRPENSLAKTASRRFATPTFRTYREMPRCGRVSREPPGEFPPASLRRPAGTNPFSGYPCRRLPASEPGTRRSP